VNAAAFTLDGVVIAAGAAKLTAMSISGWQERNDVKYRVLTYTLHIDNAGWAKSELDRGFRELDGTTGDLKNIRNDSDEELPNTPVLLDGSGARLDSPGPSTAVFITFDIYNQKDLTVLPIS